MEISYGIIEPKNTTGANHAANLVIDLACLIGFDLPLIDFQKKRFWIVNVLKRVCENCVFFRYYGVLVGKYNTKENQIQFKNSS